MMPAIASVRGRSRRSLRSSAHGFVTFIEVHEARGNEAAVAEAEAELDRTLEALERADRVRRVEYEIARLDSLGPTPVNMERVAELRRQIARRRS
jgi:hypothetical protein